MVEFGDLYTTLHQTCSKHSRNVILNLFRNLTNSKTLTGSVVSPGSAFPFVKQVQGDDFSHFGCKMPYKSPDLPIAATHGFRRRLAI